MIVAMMNNPMHRYHQWAAERMSAMPTDALKTLLVRYRSMAKDFPWTDAKEYVAIVEQELVTRSPKKRRSTKHG